MEPKFPLSFLLARLDVIILFVLTNSFISVLAHVETIETISFTDSQGVEHEELAFRAPISGIPEHVLRMYCANVKLRLYWNVYRDEVKDTKRKGIFLRRMARFAKHIFHDIRSVDRPFNATRLSIIDEYFAVKDPLDEDSMNLDQEDKSSSSESSGKSSKSKSSRIVSTLTRKLSGKFQKDKHRQQKGGDDEELQLDVLDNAEDLLESTPAESKVTMKQVKSFVKRYAAKVGMGIYTRWRTMWWLMMPCLFSKYYLWDPALDELTKLQRNLVMYPDFLTMKLQDVDCPPIKLFQRILDVCKILNPLMNIDFGQFSLDKMTRFKGDT